MGHITVDLIEEAWKSLNKAEHLCENDQTYGAVLACENALEDLYRSADGMGCGIWFSGKKMLSEKTSPCLKIRLYPTKKKC